MTSERAAAEPARVWRVGSREIILDRPIIMGILNVTPDSFSDGGNFFAPAKAVEHARAMIEAGVDIIDVGGESTRPGAKVVDSDEETRRVLPAIRAIRSEYPEVIISIDTTKSGVVAKAIDEGADVVNDVSAFRLDTEMPAVIRDTGCGVVLMHSRGGVEAMASYALAEYEGDAVEKIVEELSASVGVALSSGIARESIVLDPGFGFAKVSAHSRDLLARLEEIVDIGFPVMVGVSRKRFVTEAMVRPSDGVSEIKSSALPVEDRDAGTAALNVVALLNGARIFRVHNVRMNRRALDAVWPVVNGVLA